MSDTPLSRLLSLLSHELRAPVGVIRGYLRLLDSAGLPPTQQTAVTASLRAVERAVQLLEQASLLAALKRGEIELDLKPVPLTSVLHAASQAVVLPEDSGVTLSVTRGPSVHVTADANRLRVALTSLMTAVARAQASRITVEIAAEHAKRGRADAIRLRIGPRTVSRIAGRESALNMSRGGLGLEMPIAAAIIDAHHGEIREVRHGETSNGIVVVLPLAKPVRKRSQ